jgi:hypothetical protein
MYYAWDAMSPVLMTAILVGLIGLFALSARRRWSLLHVGAPTWESRFDAIGERLLAVWRFAFLQKKMRYYPLAAAAHYLIFLGFLVLLLRTLVLWGRGYEPSFNLWLLGPEPVLGIPLGAAYAFLKDVFALLVLLGVSVFAYMRLIRREKRMSLGLEGVVILGIIAVMMLADLVYDGASLVLAHRYPAECGANPGAGACEAMAKLVAPLGPGAHEPAFSLAEPGGSTFSVLLAGVSSPVLAVLAQIGFWTHSTLVLVFLNILPYSKHFHIITAVPNVFLGDRTPPGRLRPLAPNTEAIMGLVEKATEGGDVSASTPARSAAAARTIARRPRPASC